ncbi:DUF742 domain-containing protein [Amycolatopsis oliviviridis]|uniref:DUF742 domain-containing protein n=1 Tax=Amycolatopsis oliviviridis TaxID=1471590 RepID=UPI00174A95A2|nr:DUF742 domain-containing protein [Amycolatopsis oliviviridis]
MGLATDRHIPAMGRAEPDAVRFGGWSDYAEWADHDFRDRKPHEEPTSTGQHSVVVEVMTAVVPITLPEEPADDYVSRTSCRIVSPEGYDDVEGIDLLLEVDDQTALVRPYLGFDTQPGMRHDLALETVIETTRPYSTLPIATLGEDQRLVCRACVTPQSVAEIAVGIGAPIGLTQMLIGEGIDRGFLRVHSSALPTKDGLPSIELLRRVHRGLSRLV